MQLWLVYLGYGFLGGTVSASATSRPVSTLIKWFPDRPGLSTGLAIMGFGGGALIASPLSDLLMGLYGGRTRRREVGCRRSSRSGRSTSSR